MTAQSAPWRPLRAVEESDFDVEASRVTENIGSDAAIDVVGEEELPHFAGRCAVCAPYAEAVEPHGVAVVGEEIVLCRPLEAARSAFTRACQLDGMLRAAIT